MLRSRKCIEIYEFSPFRLDVVLRQLFYNDTPIFLPSKTLDILILLVENSGRLVTKEELLRQIWMNQFVEENNLTVRISALRKALGGKGGKRFIETVPGSGYRFAARVKEIFSHRTETNDEAFRSIAVLPLLNENNQQRLNYLCDGITDSLIGSLSQLATLKVVSRNIVFRYKGMDIDPLAAGAELGVSAILVGKLNQINNYLILSVELTNMAGGSRLWGATFKRQVSELFNLPEEIAKEVSRRLRIKVSKVEQDLIAKRHTDNSEAYTLYLKGRYFLNKRSEPGVNRSIKYFMKAIKQDCHYAPPYTGLADAYLAMSGYGLVSPRRTMPKARSAILRALEIDNQLAEAYVSLGTIKSQFEYEWTVAESAYRRAIELSPNSETAHRYYSILLVKLGRLEEAIAEARLAFNLDPLSLGMHLTLARVLYLAKQFDVAVEYCQAILDLDPEYGPANGLIGMVYLEQKHYEAAIREYKKYVFFSESTTPASRGKGGRSNAESPGWDSDPETIGVLGHTYGAAGKRKEAIKILNKLKEMAKKRYVEPHSLALVYIGLNDKNKAFEWLEKAFAERTAALTYIKVWPLFNHLQDDSRYNEMVKRMGL